MRKLILLAAACVVALVATSQACSTGCVDYHGICACDATPERAPDAVPSDEKPPRNRVPAYERGDVKADMGVRAPYVPENSEADAGKMPNSGVPVQ